MWGLAREVVYSGTSGESMETQRPRRAVEQNCSRLKKKLFPFEKLPVFPFEKLRAFPFKKLLGAGGGGRTPVR